MLLHFAHPCIHDLNPRPPDYQARFIPTRPQCHPCGLENHFMVDIMVMTAERATKLEHDQITCLEACFVIVLLIFNNGSD